jgi:hypothetical protein
MMSNRSGLRESPGSKYEEGLELSRMTRQSQETNTHRFISHMYSRVLGLNVISSSES